MYIVYSVYPKVYHIAFVKDRIIIMILSFTVLYNLPKTIVKCQNFEYLPRAVSKT